jgi:hypothetical protein
MPRHVLIFYNNINILDISKSCAGQRSVPGFRQPYTTIEIHPLRRIQTEPKNL